MTGISVVQNKIEAVTAPEEIALDVRSVSYSYRTKLALDDVSFSIAPGIFTFLLGMNGAGKTTLFSLISHLYNTRQGSIRIFGHDMSRDSRYALQRIGIVFQARTLDLDLSIYQNLAYHAALHGLGRKDAKQRIETLLEMVGMADRIHDKARALSGGQMRRIEIARALLHRPSLLLLDEATVGLDVNSRELILATIRKLVAEEGISVLWATHLMDEVQPDDGLVMLRQGKVIANGRVSDIVQENACGTIHEAFAKLNNFGPDQSGRPHSAGISS